jgi:putative endonuclease
MSNDHLVYILCNASRTLYIGMTSDPVRRMYEHRAKLQNGFTRRYNLTLLVYFGEFVSRPEAFDREQQLKGWRRDKKVALIEAMNPHWRDLSADWER